MKELSKVTNAVTVTTTDIQSKHAQQNALVASIMWAVDTLRKLMGNESK